MKSLFAHDAENRIKEYAKSEYNFWVKFLEGRTDDSALSILKEDKRKFDMTGKELLARWEKEKQKEA